MEMTYDQYIQNPMGIANAVISNRGVYRELYRVRLDKILVRELGKIDYTLYKSKNKYYVHIKIPSEVIEKFYYDVVIEFSEPKNKSLIDATLKNYNVKTSKLKFYGLFLGMDNKSILAFNISSS